MAKHETNAEAAGAAPHERPVPRISIHAFCELPDTGAVLHRAAADRRLAKAHLTVHLGGVSAAVEFYRGEGTPNLLLVETRLDGQAALDELDRLAEVCDPATKVVVIGQVNDVHLYRELMRRGAAEYLVAPLQPLALIETISGLYLDPDSKPVGRVIAFAGARGGAGSSTIAHNVGWCVAEEFSVHTTIVDFDLAFGTTGLDFNDDGGQGVADALAAPERLDDVLLDRLLIKRGEHLSLFTAPASLEREFGAPGEAYEAVVDATRAASPCVILDLPHLWTPWMKTCLSRADEIAIVATPDLASLRNAKAMVEFLRQARPEDPLPRLVINQQGLPKRPEIPPKDFAETLGIEPAAILPFDAALFGEAANNGQMVLELAPKAAISQGLRRLAGTVAARPIPLRPADKTASILSFLKSRKQA